MCYVFPTNTPRNPNNAANGDFVESFNGLKAPQPYIGNRLAIGDDGGGLQLVETPELKITCPHYSETDHDRACLASFAYDENSQYPFAEYITHFYQFHALYKEKLSNRISWSDICINAFQKLNRYTDDIEQFKADYNSVTGLNSEDAGIGENPLLNDYHYPCNVALIKDEPANPRTKDSMGFYSLLCPFCTPIFNCQKKNINTFFDVANGDYERHLREHHGFYTNGQKAPQPYIGDTLIFRDDGNGLPVNEKPELTVTCPYHLDSDHRQACLASFSFNKDSQAPFAEYFTHFYQSHVLHKEEPSWTARYRAMYFANGDGSGEKYDTNYFIPLNPGLHMIAYTDVLETIGHIQPFALPPWDVIRKYMERSPNPSYVHPFVSQDLMVEIYEELLSMSLTLPFQDSDVESDSDEEEVSLWDETELPELADEEETLVDEDEFALIEGPLTGTLSATLSPMFSPFFQRPPIELAPLIPMFRNLNQMQAPMPAPMFEPFNPMPAPMPIPMFGPYNPMPVPLPAPMLGPFNPMPVPLPAPMLGPFNPMPVPLPAPMPAPMFGPFNPMPVPLPAPMPAPMFAPFNPMMPMPAPMFAPFNPAPMFAPFNPMMPMPAPMFGPPMQNDPFMRPNSPIDPPAAENIVNDPPVPATSFNTDLEEIEKSGNKDEEEVSPEITMDQIQLIWKQEDLEEEKCFSEDNEYYGVEIRNHRKGKERKSHRKSRRIDKRFKVN
ncbi:DNA-directed RNA polymerase II subunit [Wickerhamomyces ciferrii]|uniref:DNA-directed RNA polymerase II subunit n=1 Tax=Wickerhamomyces ciferrii (strain ATCC 14091 / BCRC 22168 / CBS 111 / JCM 3599 / NBRC 0793 / NRRL Y-1031 F-60-10) TaxID=1206466 RepID=K0KQ36_WICCF|nr:DNA-directed RNA polymerase II subunit [Wickerhamomyces ciferrii]CCH43293.1 DNA-directed RNA polymerase II subunit [Wickerhamomyces ciferrii]